MHEAKLLLPVENIFSDYSDSQKQTASRHLSAIKNKAPDPTTFMNRNHDVAHDDEEE